MSISIDGNTLTWDGTVTITNATDLSTGVATLMLTPAGGVGSLPALVAGTPGLPPVFDDVTVSTLTAGSNATASLTLVSAGGAGVASHYTLALGLPAGSDGVSGTFAISDATDLEGGPPSGTTDSYIIKWVNADSSWKIVGELCGDNANATVFTSASGNTSPQTLATVTIPAQPFDWRPNVSGFAVPTGTDNTHVDLVCRLNNATTGDQVGYGKGITGAGGPAGVPAIPVTLSKAFGAAIGSGSYGRVSKGSSATLYFLAIQTAATTDSFSVPNSSCSFTVKVDPIPGTS